MNRPAADPAIARALTAEIWASERLRARILAIALATLLVLASAAYVIGHDAIQRYAAKPLSPWIQLYIIGPFLTYECIFLAAMSMLAARGRQPPRPARYGNALIETNLPTVMLLVGSGYAAPTVVFGGWPSLLYFVFIVASILRLNFTLPVFTGAVAAAGYMGAVVYLLPLSGSADLPVMTPLYHVARAFIMLLAGVVAGLVAIRLRATLVRVLEETAARDRVVNLFGQHVSPAVVDRLLDRGVDAAGDMRDVCVMFLDIRDFTRHARERAPADVVDFLNGAFAFMIEAVDRHHGIVNKFLGDGFMAVFGAPLPDPEAPRHAVEAAREILAEIDRRDLAEGPWPLRIGIGLHAGPAVVGNIGSPRRKEFTVIGDTVNLASRLEQLNKELGSRLLVSATVASALGPALATAAPAGSVAVRGYAEPVPVWRLD